MSRHTIFYRAPIVKTENSERIVIKSEILDHEDSITDVASMDFGIFDDLICPKVEDLPHCSTDMYQNVAKHDFICKKCDSAFSSKKELRAHRKNAHKKADFKIKKTVSGNKTFKLNKQGRKSVKKRKKIRCRQCKKTFPSNYYLKRHESTLLHIENCEDTRYSFPEGLEAMIIDEKPMEITLKLEKSPKKPLETFCESCHTTFTTKNLTRHLKTESHKINAAKPKETTDKIEIVCQESALLYTEDCEDIRYSFPEGLGAMVTDKKPNKIAMKLEKSPKKPLEMFCKACRTTFTVKNKKRHLKTEFHKVNVAKSKETTDKSEIVCEKCDRAFANLHNLQRHVLSVHGKAKYMVMYHCLICQKSFKRRHDLGRHYQTAAHLANEKK